MDTFNDIDIMTTGEDVETVKRLLSELGKLQPPNPNVQYRTRHFYEFVIDGVDVDVMKGFAIVKDGREYDCPFTKASICRFEEIGGQPTGLPPAA